MIAIRYDREKKELIIKPIKELRIKIDFEDPDPEITMKETKCVDMDGIEWDTDYNAENPVFYTIGITKVKVWTGKKGVRRQSITYNKLEHIIKMAKELYSKGD